MARKPTRRRGRGYPAESFVAGLTRLLGRRLGARWMATLQRLGRLPTKTTTRRRRREDGGNDDDADADPEHKET